MDKKSNPYVCELDEQSSNVSRSQRQDGHCKARITAVPRDPGKTVQKNWTSCTYHDTRCRTSSSPSIRADPILSRPIHICNRLRTWRSRLPLSQTGLSNHHISKRFCTSRRAREPDAPDEISKHDIPATSDKHRDLDQIFNESKHHSNTHQTMDNTTSTKARREEQLGQLRRIRELEKILGNARIRLRKSLDEGKEISLWEAAELNLEGSGSKHLELSKEDYLNMVDLYYYSSRSPEYIGSPRSSPTPLIYNVTESNRLRMSQRMQSSENLEAEFDAAVDPQFYKETQGDLAEFELRFLRGARDTNSLMRPFVEHLLEENPSPKKLFELYLKFPRPGVAYLPSSAIRLFLYRMSTHRDKKSEYNMIRYMSIIEDMQQAKLPISNAEWTSAIYLVGRAFRAVLESDMMNSLTVWKRMEEEAGIKSTNVTFNVLFDITVKAGKYVIADMILNEMFRRGLHLNRLGRVSFMWYQGVLGNGDGVRSAYRDFVDANEIVDTLVLNCVMVSLIRAQEPTAAEQIYERMKRLQDKLQHEKAENAEEAFNYHEEDNDLKASLVVQYPPPGEEKLNDRPASESLRPTLLRASSVLPYQRNDLQTSMALTPDYVTYRILIDLYAVKTGEVDRLAMILHEMTLFGIGMNALYFSMIFRGFANHGGSSYNKWTPELLEIVWTSCLDGMQMPLRKTQQPGSAPHHNDDHLEDEEEEEGIEWLEGEGLERQTAPDSEIDSQDDQETQQSDTAWYQEHLTTWRNFVHAFVTVSKSPKYRERAAQSQKSFPPGLLDPLDFDPRSPLPRPMNITIPSGPEDDDVEHEYPAPSRVLPPPGRVDPFPPREWPPVRHIQPSLFLIKWILRAHAKTVGRREKVEDVWFACQRLWKPKSLKEKDIILSMVARALKECDDRARYS